MSDNADGSSERRDKVRERAKQDNLNEAKKRANVQKNTLKKPPTQFIQKLSKESLDKFIEKALQSKQIDDVEILDLSRHKISEISPKIKFYMRMLRKLRVLNLYGNKLTKIPLEIGNYSFINY